MNLRQRCAKRSFFNTRRATGAPSAKRAAGGKVKKMMRGGMAKKK
jgi:hypothetical protein